MENLQNFVSKSFTGERLPTAVIRREHLSFSVEELLTSPHSGDTDGDEPFNSGDEDEADDREESDGAPLTGRDSNRLIARTKEWRIQVFQEGNANSKGAANLFFGQIFLKIAWEWRKLGREGGSAFEICLSRSTTAKYHCGLSRMNGGSVSSPSDLF